MRAYTSANRRASSQGSESAPATGCAASTFRPAAALPAKAQAIPSKIPAARVARVRDRIDMLKNSRVSRAHRYYSGSQGVNPIRTPARLHVGDERLGQGFFFSGAVHRRGRSEQRQFIRQEINERRRLADGEALAVVNTQ